MQPNICGQFRASCGRSDLGCVSTPCDYAGRHNNGVMMLKLEKVAVVIGIIAATLAAVVSYQTFSCTTFGQFCKYEPLVDPSLRPDEPSTATKASGPTETVQTTATNVVTPGGGENWVRFTRKKTLFTCQTLAYVGQRDAAAHKSDETVTLKHCRDFGGNPYTSFGRSVNGSFAYDYDTLQGSTKHGNDYERGDLLLFFAKDGMLVTRSLQLTCRTSGLNEETITEYPRITEIEYDAKTRIVGFRSDSLCTVIRLNGFYLHLAGTVRTNFRVTLTPDLNVEMVEAFTHQELKDRLARK